MTSPEEPELPVPLDSRALSQLNNDATLVLVLGIISLFVGLTGPIAFYLGRNYEARCKELGVEPEQGAVVGMYIGLVMGILSAVVIVCMGAWFVFMAMFMILWFAGVLFFILGLSVM